MITVTHFRGSVIPSYVKTKHDLVAYVLTAHRYDEPISNGEFIYDLNYSRFGTSIHKLRSEGWIIETLPAKKQGLVHYWLVKLPDESDEDTQLRLVTS